MSIRGSHKNNKGDDLEIAVARFFQAQRYFVRRGIRLAAEESPNEITDVDVLGIRYAQPLDEQKIVADCKQRRKPKVYERILWTVGLRTYLEATRGYVFASQVTEPSFEFAARGKIEVIDENSLNKWLETHALHYKHFGDADGELLRQWDGAMAKEREVGQRMQRALNIQRAMLLFGSPIPNLNRIIRFLGGVKRGFSTLSDEGKVLVLRTVKDAVSIAVLLLLRFASEVKWMPAAAWHDQLKRRLTFGDVPPDKAKQLARLAFSRDVLPDEIVPKYVDEISALVKQFTTESSESGDFAFDVERVLYGRYDGDLPVSVLRAVSAVCFAAEIEVDFVTSPMPALNVSSERKEGHTVTASEPKATTSTSELKFRYPPKVGLPPTNGHDRDQER